MPHDRTRFGGLSHTGDGIITRVESRIAGALACREHAAATELTRSGFARPAAMRAEIPCPTIFTGRKSRATQGKINGSASQQYGE